MDRARYLRETLQRKLYHFRKRVKMKTVELSLMMPQRTMKTLKLMQIIKVIFLRKKKSRFLLRTLLVSDLSCES
jgi:hypothetical protein